jgi:PhnB protein
MAVRITSYLTFDGRAREALEFYAEVLGGTAEISTFGDFGVDMAGDRYSDRVMHGCVDVGGETTLMAADMPPENGVREGDNVSLSLGGLDAEALRTCWGALAAGGTVLTPLEEQMRGDEYGVLVDRFGIRWQINISSGD